MRFTYGLIQFKSHKIYSHIEERLSVYIHCISLFILICFH